MTTNEPNPQDCIELDEPERIDSVSQLSIGDRVLIDDRAKPLTVVSRGMQTVDDPHAGSVNRPVVKVRGDWQNAQALVLTMELDGYDLSATGAIVEMALGRTCDVVRTHVAGSRDRVQNGQEVTA